jgi:hypothetical protein
MNTTIAQNTHRTLPGAALFSIWSGGAFLVLLVLVHIAKPELDPSWRPISEYALGAFGGVMTLAFLAWGLSTLALVLALRKQSNPLVSRIGLVFLAIGGIGPILAALFPTDPITTPMDALTVSGILHSIGAILGDGIAIGALLLTIGLPHQNPPWRFAHWPLLLSTIVVWIAFVFFTAQMMVLLPQHGGQLRPEVQIGWSSRVLVVVYVAWVMLAAWCASKVNESQ